MNNVGEFLQLSPVDPFDLSKDWGRSDDDQRHRLVLNGAINSSMEPATNAGKRLSHGFQLSGMLQSYSSLPFNITSGVTTVQGTAGRPIVNGEFIDRNAGIGSRREPKQAMGCRLAWPLVLTAVVASACAGERSPAPPVASSAEPSRIALSVAGRSNTAASVAAFGQTVAAVWTASTDDTSDVYISVSTDGGVTFSAPARVNDIEGDARASGEQAARVMVGYRNAVHVVWPAKREGHTVIRYAGSKDGGRTFSPAVPSRVRR